MSIKNYVSVAVKEFKARKSRPLCGEEIENRIIKWCNDHDIKFTTFHSEILPQLGISNATIVFGNCETTFRFFSKSKDEHVLRLIPSLEKESNYDSDLAVICDDTETFYRIIKGNRLKMVAIKKTYPNDVVKSTHYENKTVTWITQRSSNNISVIKLTAKGEFDETVKFVDNHDTDVVKNILGSKDLSKVYDVQEALRKTFKLGLELEELLTSYKTSDESIINEILLQKEVIKRYILTDTNGNVYSLFENNNWSFSSDTLTLLYDNKSRHVASPYMDMSYLDFKAFNGSQKIGEIEDFIHAKMEPVVFGYPKN